ncbi:hypothetical protein [uncultured Microscilla sp.]|uniref:hypothetical protein n=1 Tax=uncultured Microscilla sp. TaxID=432653 RepID=UPI002613BAE3|nr:hypothetical protein [uncultured Microscilla sp.]
MTHYKIEGYVLAGVLCMMCLLSSVTEAYASVTPQEDKVTFYIKNDLDHAVLLKLGTSTVTLDIGTTKKFHRLPNSVIYLAQPHIMAFSPEKGKEILKVERSIQGKKILLSKIVDE